MSLVYCIIIPVKEINDYVRQTVEHIRGLNTDRWEVYILTNDECEDEWHDSRIRNVATGRLGPARKRDIGAELAAGDILVFLDDDSYPNSDLLDVADTYFEDDDIVAIGGPGITPREDSFWQRVSGAVFLSRLSGGNPERYINIGEPKFVDDWPSVNLMIRRAAFQKIGGFDTDFWPGEDTILCRKIIRELNGSILYVPDLIVWHHRRSGLLKHLQQISQYAKHRGYFARTRPENSRKFLYFIPTIFVGFCIYTIFTLTVASPQFDFLVYGWVAYMLALIKAWFDIQRHEGPGVASMATFYISVSHLVYGLYFAVGISSRTIQSKLR